MKTTPLVLIVLLAIPPALPFASAANNCGSSITFASGSPTIAADGTVGLRVVFNDDADHCGVNTWSYTFARNGVYFSGPWVKLGTASLQGNDYVLEADAILDVATWTVTVTLTENCCGPTGTPVTATGSWTINVVDSLSQCGDGVDNDGDGRTDYPADIGCTSSADNTETVDCPETAPSVKICYDTRNLVVGQTLREVTLVDGPEHPVAGYVDAYRFVLPVAGPVVVPCVTLLVDTLPFNPCDEAGGTFIERRSTLVDDDVAEPRVEQGEEIATVGICQAEYAFLVAGFGLESAQAYAVC